MLCDEEDSEAELTTLGDGGENKGIGGRRIGFAASGGFDDEDAVVVVAWVVTGGDVW